MGPYLILTKQKTSTIIYLPYWIGVVFVYYTNELGFQICATIIIFLLKYVFSAMSYFCLMSTRNMRFKYLAFVPIFNTTYVLGNIADSINKDYFAKSYFRFFLLVSYLTALVAGGLALFLMSKNIPNFEQFLFESLASESRGFEVLNSTLNLNSLQVNLLISLLILTFAAASTFNLVFSFWCFYIIYGEYSKAKSSSYTLMTIIGGGFLNIKFLPPLIVFTIRHNTPIFEFLNKAKTSDLNKTSSTKP